MDVMSTYVPSKHCPNCDINKPLTEFYRRKGRTASSYCKPCNTEQVRQRLREQKRKAVEYLGGACELCGYDRSPGALTFHHRDPSTKAFGIARFHSRSFEKLKPELAKCALLCANCHAEQHDEA